VETAVAAERTAGETSGAEPAVGAEPVSVSVYAQEECGGSDDPISGGAAAYLAERYPDVRRVGLLAATVTVGRGLCQCAPEQKGIVSVVPTDDSQARVMEAIWAVKAGRWGEDVRRLIREQGEGLAAQGAQAVIAGFTQIPIVLQDGDLSAPAVDATLALAFRAVRAARGEKRRGVCSTAI